MSDDVERDDLDSLSLPAEGDDGDFAETEVVSNQRTSIDAQMIPLRDLDGWKGGDPPTEGFIKSVRKRMRQPIFVEDTGRKKGRYRIIDGRRRVKAVMEFAKEDGITEIAAVIEDAEVSDLTPITMNALRSDNVIDSARRVWRKLDGGFSDHDVALEAGDGVASLAKQLLPTIRGLRDMRKLLPELIDAVEQKKMSPWSARMAARQPESVQYRLVDILNETGRVTPDDVVAARRHKQAAAAQAPAIVDAVASVPDDTGDDEDYDHDADDFTYQEDGGYEEGRLERFTDQDRPHGGAISDMDRKENAIRLLKSAARELGHIQGVWQDIDGCIALTEDVITTLQDLS